MVAGQVRAFVQRHPAVRHATRRIRIRLPLSLGGIDPQRVPPRVRRFDLPLPRRAGAPRTGPDTLSVRAPGDLWTPGRLHARGLPGYRPDALACFLAVLEHARPGAVLDVGANVGVYAALAAARTRRRVFAFEPAPRAARAARAIAADNGLNMDVVELALSNHSGSGLLRLSPDDASNSLLPGAGPAAGRVTVPVRPLSHWREEAGVLPSVVKISTCASEPDVVSGSLEVLRRFRPWVLCDVGPGYGIGQRLTALLEPLDYHWYRVSGRPPYSPQPSISEGASRRGGMWLFSPTPAPEGLWASAEAWRTAIDDCR
ncbi:FkbM family methyltransferase [Nocardiopsis sp. RSe5-2]|uniref:FkbM family methyltransferase n=1 Tax=Nocardiopsis endophytica TaxID=3018445 RepID=A0ABT4TYW4_9ACTN|nr:FkbM family methyltransferase [Nocardiopsis endophytica]MDA2809420.1 FkbM family methyltransferase [Nocardiopsis endophytica]